MILSMRGLGDDGSDSSSSDDSGNSINWGAVLDFGKTVLTSPAVTAIASGVGRQIAPQGPATVVYQAPAPPSGASSMTKPLLIGGAVLVGALVLMRARS